MPVKNQSIEDSKEKNIKIIIKKEKEETKIKK